MDQPRLTHTWELLGWKASNSGLQESDAGGGPPANDAAWRRRIKNVLGVTSANGDFLG